MGVYANTVSVACYRICGDLPQQERFEWLSRSLTGRLFRSIEATADEEVSGWTCTDDPDEPCFETPAAFWRDRYLFFSYRRDQRRIPAVLSRFQRERAEREYLEKRPELKRPPKREREEIAERVRLSLLARTLPAPSTVDVVWKPEEGVLMLFSAASKAMERFEELFCKSFDALRPQLIYPYTRAAALLDETGQERLARMNQAGSSAALDEIRSNRWLGEEFLLWLLYCGLEGGGFRICVSGNLEPGVPFAAWLDDRIQLQGGGSEGPQKVSVSGVQDRYLEARSALRSGKAISSAAIHMEKDELQWRFVLDAELFTFSSFKCPAVRVERQGTEVFSERESVFYERMYLLETGLQMFDSLLLTFLQERLGGDWQDKQRAIAVWLEDGQP